MKPKPTILAASLAGGALLAGAAFGPSRAQRQPAVAAFDALFANGAVCAPAQGGPPPLLTRLIQAQPETAPFKPAQQAATPAGQDNPPLFADLGKLHVPITTTSAKAQAYFNQGMRLTFAFNHAEAARAFRAAQGLDPACAMCH